MKVYQIDQIYRVLGIIMKRLYGFAVVRPLQRFNVDNRARRVLDREEEIPRMAPRHEGTQEKIDRLLSEYPDLRKSLESRRDDLLDRLKSVKVVSREQLVSGSEEQKYLDELREEEKQKMPQSRSSFDFPWHAYAEPEYVPKYKAHLGTTIKIFEDNLNKPGEYTAEKLAEKYVLNVEDVTNILKYFKPFQVYTGSEDQRDKGFFRYLSAERLKSMLDANRMNEFNLKIQEKLKERFTKEGKEGKESKEGENKKES